MVDVKTVVVSIVAVLSVFLQNGIRAQPTIGSSSEDDSCSQLEEELHFQADENMRLRSVLESERQRIKTLENVTRAQSEENLKLKLENERCQLSPKTVTATFITSFDQSQSHHGITKVDDKIYVLNHSPNRISIYEDRLGFRFMTNISLSGTGWPYDIVYSNESKYVYLSDYTGKCIWMMTTTGEHRLTKWLTYVTKPYTLSLSNEGHLLVLRQDSQDTLEIYSLNNATLIRRIQLPQDFKAPHHVVQTSVGNFILRHRLSNTSSGPWVISQLTNDGQLIQRFIPRRQSETLNLTQHLSLDSDNNRLFVADYANHRVILFDANDLTWSQVLVSQDTNAILKPVRLFYDASKKYLFVGQLYVNVTVYDIN